jgi:hypothetical protein
MIKLLKISGIFISGILVGAILMNLLDMHVRPSYREMLKIEMKTEQKYLASRSTRQGDKMRAVIHRWNVVDAQAKDGFAVFNYERNKDIDSSFTLPFQILALNSIIYPIEGKYEKAAQISEGMDRGRLALALEDIGNHEEAERQWEMARTMTNKKSISEIRNIVIKVQDVDNTETYREAEKAILGENNLPTSR